MFRYMEIWKEFLLRENFIFYVFLCLWQVFWLFFWELYVNEPAFFASSKNKKTEILFMFSFTSFVTLLVKQVHFFCYYLFCIYLWGGFLWILFPKLIMILTRYFNSAWNFEWNNNVSRFNISLFVLKSTQNALKMLKMLKCCAFFSASESWLNELIVKAAM